MVVAAASVDAVRQAGGTTDLVDLPKADLRGNSHMLMMDQYNLAMAELIQEWLAKRGLYR